MASINKSWRISSEEDKELDERIALAGKESFSEFARAFTLNLFRDADEFAVLCGIAAREGVPVEELIVQLVRQAVHATSTSITTQLDELHSIESARISRSQFDMLAQMFYLVATKASAPEVAAAEKFADEAVAAKFEKIDAVAAEKLRHAQLMAVEVSRESV